METADNMTSCVNNTNSSIQIVVDDRERNDKLLLALKESPDTDVQISRLIIGDYLLQNLLVERKTFADLCASIVDGRLFRQAALLTSSGKQPIIILEGTSADIKATGIKREAIQGALIILTLIFRIPVLRSRSPEETARLILYASRQIQNYRFSQEGHQRQPPGRNNLSLKKKMQIHVLQGFPGLGPKRSNQLLSKFGTLAAIFNASPHELAKVPGINKNLVRRITDLLN